MSQHRRVWPVLLASAIGLAILLSLGVWQVQRLAWKEGLIARLDANLNSPPLSLAEAEAQRAAGETMTFRPVEVAGEFRHANELHLISVYDGGPGWIIVTPLVAADGRAVLVDRGVVPDAALADMERPEGPVTVTGLIRDDARRKGAFDPDNDPAANRWYWWDVPSMASAAGLRSGDAAAFVIQTVPVGPPGQFPHPLPPNANLRNNHLGYAITWFGLAAVLVVMTVLYVVSLKRKSAA